MKKIALIFFILSHTIIFSQRKKIVGDTEIFLPKIRAYQECAVEKVSKTYKDLFITKPYDLLGFYLNDETYKFNKLSELYDGLSDFGYLKIHQDLKKQVVDDDLFNHLLSFNDSINGEISSYIFNEKSLDEIFLSNPLLIKAYQGNNKHKAYVSLISIDSSKLYCIIDNSLNLKNRYFEYSYYVKVKDKSSLSKAIGNNNYLIKNFFQANGVKIDFKESSHKPYKQITTNTFFTSDGFNLGTTEEFGVLFSEGEEIIDLNGIKISPAQFWECNANLYISSLDSKTIVDALEKQNFEEFIPDDNKLDQIMKCIGNGFSVGESYIDLCIERYQSLATYSLEESQKFCRCEYENLLVRVDDYNDYMKYYDEIGDQNKPSYNEIILPCRNSFKKTKGSNLYNPSDIEGFSDQSIVKLLPDGTTFKVKLTINGIVRYFVYDTGASELVINSELEKELLKTGKISMSDYVDSKQFETADGSLIEAKGVRLNNIVMGGFRVNNVVAYITKEGGMLCGMGLMNKFRTWELDKKNKMVTIYK